MRVKLRAIAKTHKLSKYTIAFNIYNYSFHIRNRVKRKINIASNNYINAYNKMYFLVNIGLLSSQWKLVALVIDRWQWQAASPRLWVNYDSLTDVKNDELTVNS